MTMTGTSNSKGTQGLTGPKIAQTAGPNTTGPHTGQREHVSMPRQTKQQQATPYHRQQTSSLGSLMAEVG